MSLKKLLHFSLIKFNRYILGKQFMPIFSGPLKGFIWSTSSNYDYLTGEYEDPDVLQAFFSWLQPDSVFYDLGANVGYYAFLAEQRITSGMIYSFEPIPRNIEMFNKHIALNKDKIKTERISLHPFAISDSEKEVLFSNDDSAIEGNTYVKDTSRFRNAGNIMKIKSYSIDGLVEKGFKPPDVIKIDVEGAEYDVLKGAINTLRSRKPNILLATHDCHLPGVKDKCIELLQSLGYNLQHTGYFNKHVAGHDDYIAIHKDKA